MDRRTPLRVQPLFDSRSTAARLRRLLSPRWVARRVAATAFAMRNPDAPLLATDALLVADRWLRKEHFAFEWGSSFSTAWLAQRAGRVVAVEQDPLWHSRMQSLLAAKGLADAVELRLAPGDEYVAQIQRFADDSIDFVLVDGPNPAQSLAASLRKLKHGGMLVVNGAHLLLPSDSTTPDARSRADGPHADLDPAELVELMRWRLKWESDGVNDTAIFWKP
ncbi:MAG TPA: hypothetical protein VGH20_15220 [Myxococcales bacterium]